MVAGQSRELALLDHADCMLAEARSFDEIKTIRDKAEAARSYVKAAQLGLELQNRAAEVKLRAERKAGSILSKLMLHGGDRRSKTHGTTLKLADLGITRDQSRRWQQQATVPERDFLNFLKVIREEGKEVTSAGLLRLAATLRHRHFVNKKRRLQRPRGEENTTSITAYRTPTSELLVELGNHRELLAQILRPLYEDGETILTSGERRMIRRLLGEMQELMEQLRTPPS
jgi:hypothetical protein